MSAIIKFVAAIFFFSTCAFFCAALCLNVVSVLQFPPALSVHDTAIMIPTIALMFVSVLLTLRLQRDTPQRMSWKILWSICPSWAKKVSYSLFAYTLVIWAILAYVQSTGQRPSPVPFLTSFAMIVSFSAAMTFYALSRDPTLLLGRYCPNRHRVSPLDNYCPQCGATL